ncbi:MAG: DNA polymerase III subunit delta [Patescibacteria group bacterium]
MIVTLTGNNSFALRRRLDELTSRFVKEYGELALEKFDGEENEAQAITEGLQSLPFLAQKKLVVVRSGGANKEFVEVTEQIISSIGDTTDVIFLEPQIDKRTAYFKVLKTKTQFEEFNELDPQSLTKWLVEETKTEGGQLNLSDANYLVERVGTNQNLLSSELNKLLIYKSEITRQNIDLLTEPTPQSKVFDLLDAAFAGRKEQALRLYDDQRAQKVEPQAILAMIAWQLQQIAITKMAGNRTITEVSRDSSMKEYPLKKAKNLADKLSEDDLKKMISEALDIDWRGKTTSLDLDEALKNYIISL